MFLSKMRRIIAGLSLVVAGQAAFAAKRGAQELVPAGHWLYDSLKEISLERSLHVITTSFFVVF